jgi:hypothetical protein
MRTNLRPVFSYAPGSDWCAEATFKLIESGQEYTIADCGKSKACQEGFPTFKLTLEVGSAVNNFRFTQETELAAFVDYLSLIHATNV